MTLYQGPNCSFDEEISNDESEVINKFLAFYRNQSVIVADEYKQQFSTVPLEDKKIIFKMNEDTWKSMNFNRIIYNKGKPYVVELELWRVGHKDNDPKCLSIREFRIITKGKEHFINLNTKDALKNNWLFNIISIFDEKKIISPEQAHCKRMNVDKKLQKFMANHEWEKIDEGINQEPILANALFIIREEYENYSHYTADFGTILYQLISYRQNNLNSFSEKDLLELDKLILKLRKTELLKVQLRETISAAKSSPTSSILLESNNYSSRMHNSQQYTVDNGELSNEKKVLNKCIRPLK